jgi:hypothetical protein
MLFVLPFTLSFVVVEWVALLLNFHVILGSNLGTETETDILRMFMVFLTPFRQILGQYLKLGHNGFLPHPLPFIIH